MRHSAVRVRSECRAGHPAAGRLNRVGQVAEEEAARINLVSGRWWQVSGGLAVVAAGFRDNRQLDWRIYVRLMFDFGP